jgi:hypothetical protein
VLVTNPRHSRAHYNLSMLYLNRVYGGLQRYLQLEPDAGRQRAVQSLIDQLENMAPTDESI